jgi:hypothetical protein
MERAVHTTGDLILEDDWSELQLTSQLIFKTVERFFIFALGFVLLAFVFGLSIGPQLAATRFFQSSGLTVAIPPLPIVEPLMLKNVTKDAAKQINDQTPFTSKPVSAAAPFFLPGSVDSFERATDCLAATIFYEAGAEPISGQMAVVQVVLNRVRHPAYPKTVCGVVFQGQERRTGCQFSFTCDGSMARRPSDAAWQRARVLSAAMLKGLVYGPVGLATHYHTDWVLPAWSAQLDKVRVERTHLFFRYTGYWGTPAAFHGRYGGNEPSFAKLATLSSAHRIGLPLETRDVTDVVAPEAADTVLTPLDAELNLARTMPERVSESMPGQDDTATAKGKDIFIIYVDPLLEPDSLSALGARACGALKSCKVLAWTDTALMPRGLPLDRQERTSMAYSYVRSGSGANKSRWNCSIFPRANKGDCLAGTANPVN